MFERESKQLRCPKCKKYHIQVQAVNDVKAEKKHGCGYYIYLLCGGIFIEILTAPFKTGKRGKAVMKTRSYAVCQDCGYHWEIKQ